MKLSRLTVKTCGLLVCLLMTATASAQPSGGVRGKAEDADFNTAVSEVTVRLRGEGVQRKVTTGDQGNYVFQEVPAGTYTLVFEKPGYQTDVESDVVVSAGQLAEVNASLSGEFTEMREFVVRDLQLDAGSQAGLLELRSESPEFLSTIGEQQLSDIGAGDVSEGLSAVSGATVTGGNFAAIRGLPPRFVSTQLNGFTLPSADPDTRSVQLDLFPTEVVESIQVTKTFTPDQQGDASGGAVNIVTKSIPDENFFDISAGAKVNSQRPSSGAFLTDGRDVDYWGGGDGRALTGELMGLASDTDVPPGQQPLGPTQFGNPGPIGTDPPTQYDWNLSAGLQHELPGGVEIGGVGTFFWERSTSHFDNGINDDLVLDNNFPDRGLIPRVTGTEATYAKTPASDDDIDTALFDVTESQEEVTWGGLGTLGLESENHELSVTFFRVDSSNNTARISNNTRGKTRKFPGHDPTKVETPGGFDSDPGPADGPDLRAFSPFRRLEQIEFVRRKVQSLQFQGRHTAPVFEDGVGFDDTFELLSPKFRWNVARSESVREQPGTRIFDTLFFSPQPRQNTPPFLPDRPARPVGDQRPRDDPDNQAVGAFNVIFRDIEEESEQYSLAAELPFEQWTGDEGSLEFGLFDDQTVRNFRQDTFFNNDFTNSFILESPFDGPRLSEAYANPERFRRNTIPNFAGDPPNRFDDRGALEPSLIDFTYRGEQNIEAWYVMADVPLTSYLKVTGGARFESTDLSTSLTPDDPANTTVFFDQPAFEERRGRVPDGAQAFDPALANADLQRDDVLPSLSVELTPFEDLKLRAAYSETIARPTFRELTPVGQRLFFGQNPFVGNPFLKASTVENYDLRLDWRPFPDSLVSVSYFKKFVTNPIETVQQPQPKGTLIRIPVNYPKGEVEGFEFEVRQGLGRLYEPLQGLSVGGNATLLDTQVTIRQFERQRLRRANAPQRSRPMTNAPEFLYNLFLTYNSKQTGTRASLFYTVTGDKLLAGPGVRAPVGDEFRFFVPAVYQKERDTLNFTLSQKIGEHITLSFSAENLTNSERQTVFRSDRLSSDVVKTSHTDGIDFSLGISADFKF